MQIIGYVLVIIVLGRFLAELLERINYPGIVGEITAGLLLGYFLRNVPAEEMNPLAKFGIFFLMILAGLEITPEELRIGGKRRSCLSYRPTCYVRYHTSLYRLFRLHGQRPRRFHFGRCQRAPIVIRIKRFFGGTTPTLPSPT